MSAAPIDDPRVRGIDTDDPDVAHELIRRTYRVTDMDVGGADPFRFRRTVVGDERFAFGDVVYTGDLRATSQPLPYFCVTVVRQGRFGLASDRDETRAAVGDRFVFPTDGEKQSDWHDIHLSQVMLDREAVEREIIGLSLAAPTGLDVLSFRPVSEAHASHWQGAVGHVFEDVVRNDAAMASPLIRGAAFRSLVAAFVETFETTVVGLTGSGDARPLPSTVRRALAYIEEHAHDDIGVVEIATAARLTPRGLQLAFRRHLETTPMTALRAARLRGAHADLLVADPTQGHTVAGVALSWGFANAGRFTAAYAARFGRSPRETLEA